MIISFTNVIGAIRSLGEAAQVITTNLKMWIGFETSVANQEQVVDGDFPTGTTAWSIGDGWNVTNNRLNVDTDDGSQFAKQLSILEVGKTYVLTLDVSLDVGEIKFESGGSPNFIITTSDTTISHTFVATLADVIFRRNVATTRGYIDNISVKLLSQITPDKSGNNNVGELFTGKAIEFDGFNDTVSFSFTTPIKSAVFWLNPLDTGYENIIHFGGAFSSLKSIRSNGNVIETAGLSSVSVYVNGVQSSSVPLNQWSRVVVNFASVTPSELKFGYAPFAYGYIQLSNVQFYNENLSLDDIAYDYANPQNLVTDRDGTSIGLSNLKGYWHLSEGDGLVAYDSSGEDNNGTINGATYEPAQPRIPQLGMQNWSKGSNLYPFSEDFENSDWIKNAGTTITNNYATSPNGDLTAARYLGTGQSGLYDTFTLSANSYTLSFYVKSNTSQTQLCRLVGDSNQVSSNLSVTTDWNRISYTFTASGLANKANGIYRDSNDNDLDILIWGAQLEQSSSAGNYRLTDGGGTLNSTVIANPTIPTKDIFGNLVRDRDASFNLDGSGYAEVADDTDLDFGTGDFTLECWAKYDFLNQGSGWNVLVSNGSISSSGGSGFSLASSTSNFSIRLNAGSAVTKTFGTDNMTVGNWYHLVVTREGTSLKTYRDTSLKSSSTIISVDVDTSLPVKIGRDSKSDRFYQNLISDVRLYKGKALSSTEIENNYNAGLSAHTN